MLKITKISLAAVLLAVGISINAHAYSVTPATNPKWTGNNTANMNAAAVAAAIGSGPLVEVYKQNVGENSDSGSFASSYKTTFSAENSAALIDYKSGAQITGGSIYLYVKDGNHQPAWYVFNISDWNGTDDLVLSGFWPGNGEISHVTILTGAQPSQDVPDAGGTLALMGVALGSLGLLRRKFAA